MKTGHFSADSLQEFSKLSYEGGSGNRNLTPDFSGGLNPLPSSNLISAADLGEARGEYIDFTRCVRPNGTAYGTAGKCRLGVEEEKAVNDLLGMLPAGEKVVTSTGEIKTRSEKPEAKIKGTLSEGALSQAKEQAKENSYSWDEKHEKIFDTVYAKAKTKAELTKIHKALIKKLDEGELDAKEGVLNEIKKALSDAMEAEGMTSKGEKRVKELESMTPEQRRRAATRDAIERGLRSGVVKYR